jgi:hypothetical protein
MYRAPTIFKGVSGESERVSVGLECGVTFLVRGIMMWADGELINWGLGGGLGEEIFG